MEQIHIDTRTRPEAEEEKGPSDQREPMTPLASTSTVVEEISSEGTISEATRTFSEDEFFQNTKRPTTASKQGVDSPSSHTRLQERKRANSITSLKSDVMAKRAQKRIIRDEPTDEEEFDVSAVTGKVQTTPRPKNVRITTPRQTKTPVKTSPTKKAKVSSPREIKGTRLHTPVVNLPKLSTKMKKKEEEKKKKEPGKQQLFL